MANREAPIKDRLINYRERTYTVGKERFTYSDILSHLEYGLGHASFMSDAQELVCLKVINEESVLGILATGSGKSTAFLLPAYLRRNYGVTLVVSPLKALMGQFEAGSDWVVAINSDKEIEERKELWDGIARRKYHLVMCAPETLRSLSFKKKLIRSVKKSERRLGPIVLDEVHCISDWGRDFRPEYWWTPDHLNKLQRMTRLANVPRVLLTATADDVVQAEVLDLFGLTGRRNLPQENLVKGPLCRPEIFLAARECADLKEKFDVAARFLDRQANRPLPDGTKRRVLVYTQEAVAARRERENGVRPLDGRECLKADEIADELMARSTRRCSIEAMCFSSRHMNLEEKQESMDFFVGAGTEKSKVRVIVATSAFGMGMDYERIPGVLHFYPRSSLSEYWQQVGRSGRGFDIEEHQWAEALSLYSQGDMERTFYQAQPFAPDGLINAFTIPALGLMMAWEHPPGSPTMSLVTPTGRTSKFGKYIEHLQERKVLGARREFKVFPDEYGTSWGYPIDVARLRAILNGPGGLDAQRELLPDPAKKYVRYMAIAARGRPKKSVRLSVTDVKEDRFQTVLSRLGRWCDVGALERAHRLGNDGLITFRVTRTVLTKRLVNDVLDDWEAWRKVRNDDYEGQLEVLRASGHEERVRRIHGAYGEESAPLARDRYSNPRTRDKVPRWMS